MITDEERREVARRLRGLHLGGGSKDLIERTLSDAIGAWRESGMSWDFITERLADLIEPVERMCLYYDADTNHCGCYDTRLIDRDALLALADEMDNPLRQAVWNQEPGVRREHIMSHYARRIREACGEEEPCDEQS